MTTWQTAVGTRGTREDFKKLYGGSINAGIQTPKDSENILVYSDPKPAGLYGYGLDGWAPDRSFFRYTGHGSVGDQILHVGNKALAEQPASGKKLRLFLGVDTVPGSGTRIHEYQGEFTLDPENPYVLQTQPDQNKEPRKTFVFNLVPVGQVKHTADEATSTKALVPSLAYAEIVDLEINTMSNFAIPAQDAKQGEKVEASLVDAFKEVLKARGHEAKRVRIYAPGAKWPMFTDIYDQTANILYEAKATAGRNDVRGALGQILDYRRFVGFESTHALLPERPAQDLIELLWGHDIGVVYRDGAGDFMLCSQTADSPF